MHSIAELGSWIIMNIYNGDLSSTSEVNMVLLSFSSLKKGNGMKS